MAQIYPFRALHYNPALINDLQKVVTQPYDKISPEMQARYYDASPFNLVRLILRRKAPNAGENIYREASCEFRRWLDQRILISEAEPGIYPYTQEYSIPGEPAGRKRRWGFIALLRLEDYGAGVVHRHEETLSGPKADRTELLKATRANFGHIFMLYGDPERSAENLLQKHLQRKPWQQARDEYLTLHSVWRVTDPYTVEQVVEAMRPKKLVIADGHHRYETSLAYWRRQQAEAPEDDRAGYVMATFVPLENDGLTILPTHRVVHSLKSFAWDSFTSKAAVFFDVEALAPSGTAEQQAHAVRQALDQAERERPSIAVYAGPNQCALLRLRPDINLHQTLNEYPETLSCLDVVLLHALILENVMSIDRQDVREQKHLRYVREAEQAINEIASGQAQIAFLLNPTPIEAVCENAFAGQVLPQKSTDFYPKLLSGLTMYWMDNPAGL
jgi:uncharacterized protein (DUF1015 family)